jgi:hypothetical protein
MFIWFVCLLVDLLVDWLVGWLFAHVASRSNVLPLGPPSIVSPPFSATTTTANSGSTTSSEAEDHGTLCVVVMFCHVPTYLLTAASIPSFSRMAFSSCSARNPSRPTRGNQRIDHFGQRASPAVVASVIGLDDGTWHVPFKVHTLHPISTHKFMRPSVQGVRFGTVVFASAIATTHTA